MPSAFSVIGRRPSFTSATSHHHDFSTTLSHDPLMVSAASPGLPRSPTTTTGSWWRPTSNTHVQSMNSPDLFGNPLLWLPHDQEHLHPHESLGYHNPQSYRNFEILNGTSPGGYYGSATRFFPETCVTSHSLHNISTLGKERSRSWEERPGHGHGLMLDSSGNGFSSWQEFHQTKAAEKQQKPSAEPSEEKRNQGIPNNRSYNLEDTHSYKNIKQGNKYLDSENNAGSSTCNTEPRPNERQNHSRQDISLPLEHRITQTESNTQSVPTISQSKGVSTWKSDMPMNHGQYKRDSVINTLDTAPSSSIYTSQTFPKPATAQTVQSNQSHIPDASLRVSRQTGGKPPLLERFREAGITRKDNESSSDGRSSEGAEDDDESESDSDANSEEEISEDGVAKILVAEKVCIFP